MALTIVEAAKQGGADEHKLAIVETFAEANDLLRVMPFVSIGGNSYHYNQEQTLPGIGFRGVNDSFTESVGVLNPQTENLVIAGGDLDVDKYITKTMGEDRRATHELMKAKALAHTIGHKMIKGDSSTDPKEFDGLQKRLGGNQIIDMGTGAMSLTNLDTIIDRVDDATHLLMNQAMSRHLTVAARKEAVGGNITWTKDEFGRRVMRYNDLPILLADRNDDLFATLDFSEPGSTTSVYVLSIGEGKYEGLQNGDMEVRDLGELQSGTPADRTRVEWYVAQALEHPRAAARLYGITDVAIIA